MTNDEPMRWGDENTVYDVVINHEEQYSIWPTYKSLPFGWPTVGKHGTKADCLAHIDEVWVDMRPLSLRQAMDAQAQTASVSTVDATAQ